MPSLALVLASACWASTVIAQKAIIEALAVTEITGLRFLIGAAVMFLVAVALGQVRDIRRIGWAPVIMGFLEPGAASLFLVWGVANTSAVSASVILSTIPILMPLLGWLVLQESTRAGVLIGAVITIAGTVLLVQAQSVHGGGSLKGDLLCVLGVLFICANQLLARRVAQVHGQAMAVSALQLTAAGLLSLAVLVTIERPPVYLARLDAEVIGTVVFIGLMGGAIPFFLYNFGLRHLPVGRLSLIMALMGPMGAVMAWAYLDTPVAVVDAAAIAMVVLGVFFPTLVDRFRARAWTMR